MALQEPTLKQPVIVAGKDVKEVDNDYFLIPVKIMDHEGPLRTSFPVENRLLPQGVSPSFPSTPCPETPFPPSVCEPRHTSMAYCICCGAQ